MFRNICATIVITIVVGLTGCGDLSKTAVKGPVPTVVAAKKSAKMTRAEFKKCFSDLNRANTSGIKVKYLYDAFDTPTRTQTINGQTRWYWQCSDGTIELVLHNTGSGHEPEDNVVVKTINDF